MTQRMAEFSKVSYEQFRRDWIDTYCKDARDWIDPVTKEVKIEIDNIMRDIYSKIELPKRATAGSAGYDFHIPDGFTLRKGDSIKIPTGIRCEMCDGWVLMLYPRSGLGFKYGMSMANTVPVVDSDYAYADNEGHIMIKLVNNSSLAKDIRFETGDAFCQGVFLPYGITLDDNVTEERHGGFGSTSK